MTKMTSDPLAERVLAYADRYKMLPEGTSVLAAVSGGADSMCLLSMLLSVAPLRRLTVSAAHFNHGLREDEADRDEEFVRGWCRERCIPFFSEKGDVSAFAAWEHLGTEEAARLLRYRFLEEARKNAGATAIATAHNAGDNAETVLFRLVRGTGPAGLSGIPPVNGLVIRPLLSLTREEIEAYNRRNAVPWITDSTNLTDDYTRNRLRHHAVPVLKELNPRFEEAAGRLACLCEQDEDYFRRQTDAFLADFPEPGRTSAAALIALHPAVSSRVIRRLAGKELSMEQTESVLRLCKESSSGSLDLSGTVARLSCGILSFGETEAAPFGPVLLIPGEPVVLPGGKLSAELRTVPFDGKVHKSFTDYLFSSKEIYGRISLRSRRDGDSYTPRGRGCRKSLKKLFSECRIPVHERNAFPVIEDDAGILGVWPFGPAERGLPEAGDLCYQILFKELD